MLYKLINKIKRYHKLNYHKAVKKLLKQLTKELDKKHLGVNE